MNMKLLLVVTSPPAIYHGCYTWRMSWEDKFIPVDMTICIRRNVRKHREIKNGEKYIALDIFLKLDFLDKR